MTSISYSLLSLQFYTVVPSAQPTLDAAKEQLVSVA